ncbi:type IV toxin-antitoxin system AbiEi family antitoxin [uncultured Microbacterium sp.]|uniref:type IV toxin-antitoxin system AbiEi family antitoxin n=1 Tax=uncultured Microbacterium sp. TaxID=191216 RepID=UPI0035CBCF2D
MPSTYLYFANGRLSIAELSAARLDGHLVELGEGYIPADAIETAALRAGSLAELLGDTLAATHLTAAWVHGALPDPPARHSVQRCVPQRLHHVFGRRIVYRELRVDDRDLQRIGGVLVTSPARTLADLARVCDDQHIRAARALAEGLPALAADALAWMSTQGSLPHKRPAMTLLRELEARSVRQDDVTR